MGWRQDYAWRFCAFALAAVLTAATVPIACAEPARPVPATGYAETVKDLHRLDGLAPVYLDGKGGRVLISLRPAADGTLGT